MDGELGSIDLSGRTVLLLVTEDWYFWSHRLPLARAARDAGARVVVAARMSDYREAIRAEGFELHDIPFDRAGFDPRRDFAAFAAITGAYRGLRPDLVHHVALKPSLYGALSAWLTGVPAVANAMAGMGYLFTSSALRARLFQPLVRAALRVLNNRANTRLIVQNDDDRLLFEQDIGVRPERIVVIRGSGVDIAAFTPVPERSGRPLAICVSRMLWDKGVGELVEAARELKRRGCGLTIRLVGPGDANPASVPAAILEEWRREGSVEIAGPSTDIAGEYARAHIAVLPSYREGLPKSLLEAGACGRPMVATDVPGCREICRDGITGLLVPAKTVGPLADALQRLAEDQALRRRMGEAARALVEREFSDRVVAARTLRLYKELMDGAGRG